LPLKPTSTHRQTPFPATQSQDVAGSIAILDVKYAPRAAAQHVAGLVVLIMLVSALWKYTKTILKARQMLGQRFKR